MDPRRYLAAIILMLVSLGCAVAAFNWFMDPFGIYKPPVVAGLNDVHPASASHAFLHKSEAVRRLKPDAVIIGTSRADTCLDPRPEFFPGLTPYNLSLPAATVEEQRLLLEFAHRINPLKRAVITLDFFAFDARRKMTDDFEPARLAPGAPPVGPALLLSLDTLAASAAQLLGLDRERQPHIAVNGMRVPNNFAADAKENGAGWAFRRGRFTDPRPNFAVRAIGSRAMAQFRAMTAFLHDNKIDAQFVVMPLHDVYHAMLKETGQDDFMVKWEHMVMGVLRAEAKLRKVEPFPLHRFAHRHGYSNEFIPLDGDTVSQTQWFWDPSHCKAALGDIILRKLAAPKASREADAAAPQ